jgi:hypothetical protein
VRDCIMAYCFVPFCVSCDVNYPFPSVCLEKRKKEKLGHVHQNRVFFEGVEECEEIFDNLMAVFMGFKSHSSIYTRFSMSALINNK